MAVPVACQHGPACSLVEIKDGNVTCWSGTQKSHFVPAGIRRDRCKCRREGPRHLDAGPGSYGRNDADDCAMDAGVLAKAVGKPVRCNICATRAPAGIPRGRPRSTARAALDASGNVIAYDFLSKASRASTSTPMAASRYDTLAGQTLGVALKSGDGFGVPAESYAFANKRTAWETIAPLLDRASPLRTSHLRDPVGPQIHFASESFMDEWRRRSTSIRSSSACATSRTRATSPSSRRRPKRPAGRRGRRRARTRPASKVSGRGIAYAQRNGTRVAVIAEVDIDRSSGKIWARKFTVAHDCGQIINPDGLQMHRRQHRAGRQPHAVGGGQVRPQERHQRRLADLSDPRHHRDAGGQIDVVLINHPEIAPSGAGEPSIRPVAAAIANAIFDATGVRIRRVPFSPERVKAAFS
jgi:nicotinate dehydrogenase subunit B